MGVVQTANAREMPRSDSQLGCLHRIRGDAHCGAGLSAGCLELGSKRVRSDAATRRDESRSERIISFSHLHPYFLLDADRSRADIIWIRLWIWIFEDTGCGAEWDQCWTGCGLKQIG